MAAHISSFEIGSETGSALCQIAPRECFEGRYRWAYRYRFASLNRYLFNNIYLFTIANKAD